MKELTIETKVKVFRTDEIPSEYVDIVLAAGRATEGAYAPYSKFKVGAAVWLEDGTVVTGNNQENAAYPSGLCAERVALFSANAQYPGLKVKAIAIAAVAPDGPVEMITPCGACRQVLLEAELRQNHSPIVVLLYGRHKTYVAESAASLLPLSFDGSDLPRS